MASGSDKRKQLRVPVELWIEATRGEEVYFQRATNLSIGGAYFDKTIPLPLGTQVTLKFELPGDSQEVRCRGEIVTVKNLGMGVTFMGLKAADEARVEKLVNKISATRKTETAVPVVKKPVSVTRAAVAKKKA